MARKIVSEILFAGVGRLDRRSPKLIGDFCGLLDEFELEPVAKAAPGELVVENDLLRIMPRDRPHKDLQLPGQLMTCPDLHPVVFNQNDRVERFQWRMGDIGRPVFRRHDFRALHRSFDVPVIPPCAVEQIVGKGCLQRLPVVSLLRRIGRGTPVVFHRSRPFESGPCVVREHGNAAGDLQHVAHTGNRAGLAVVETLQSATLTRVRPHGGMYHPRLFEVDPIGKRPGGFGHDVDTLHGLADKAPGGRIAQRHILHRIEHRRIRRQIGIGDTAAIGQQHGARLRLQLIARNAGAFCGSQFQRFARGGACLAQLVETVRHGG